MSFKHWLSAAIPLTLFFTGPAFAQSQPHAIDGEVPSEQAPTAGAPSAGQPAGSAAVQPSQPFPPYPECPACPECPCAKWGSSRLLGGHRFIFPTFIESAFVSSYLGARAGVGKLQVFNLPFGRLGRVDLEQVSVVEGLDVGLRLFDGLGLFATFSGLGISGINSRTVLIRTGSYELAARGGAIIKLLRGENALLSLRARAGGANGSNLTLLPLLSQVAATPIASAEQVISGRLGDLLTVPFHSFDWGGSAVAALAFSSAISLQASLGFTVERTTLEPFDVTGQARRELTLSSTTPEAGLAFTADARMIGVPFALMLEYEFTRESLTNEETDRTRVLPKNTVAAGLFYSGRPDLQTGILAFARLGSEPIEGSTVTGAPAESDKPRDVGGTLTLRYIW